MLSGNLSTCASLAASFGRWARAQPSDQWEARRRRVLPSCAPPPPRCGRSAPREGALRPSSSRATCRPGSRVGRRAGGALRGGIAGSSGRALGVLHRGGVHHPRCPPPPRRRSARPLVDAPSWPAMNSESLTLCEHPNVFTCTTRGASGGDLGGRDRAVNAARRRRAALAESLVASPDAVEARTFSSSTSSAPLAAAGRSRPGTRT